MKAIGQRITFDELEVNDLFYHPYGFGLKKFRVHEKYYDFLVAHALSWIKSDSITFLRPGTNCREQSRLLIFDNDTPPAYYAGKVSKLRAFFLI